MNFLGKFAINAKIRGNRLQGWTNKDILYDIENSNFTKEQIEYAKEILQDNATYTASHKEETK